MARATYGRTKSRERRKAGDIAKRNQELINYINAETQTDGRNKMCATSTLNVAHRRHAN